MKLLKATIVCIPERKQEEIWTRPEHFEDKRNFFERVLNINPHKIEKHGNRGQKFRGKTIITPGTFKFDEPVELNKKIANVETEFHQFYGVIPLKKTLNGTLCSVDYFISKGR